MVASSERILGNGSCMSHIRPAGPVLAVVLVLSLGACGGLGDLGGQIRGTLRQGVDAVSDALAEADRAISGASRSAFENVQTGVERLRERIADAADLAGDEARQAYERLMERAAKLRRRADDAAKEASAKAREAWERIQAALAELEARIEAVAESL
jgi:chromosome segregation ATPase